MLDLRDATGLTLALTRLNRGDHAQGAGSQSGQT